jgi:hypothetical protein
LYREYQYWFFHRTSDHGAISVRQLSARDSPQSSANAPARMHPEIVYGCGVPTGGIYDFSAMTPFAPAAALPWSSNF